MSRQDWEGLLAFAGAVKPSVELKAPIRRARSSGAGAFLGIASDGRQYWFKVPGNPQGNQVLVNEVIVRELSRLVDGPVRESIVAAIPGDIARSWTHYPSRTFGPQILAHASLHVDDAIDDDELRYTKKGDNAERQARLLALWDWCVGEDEQWLYETRAAYRFWSYDHGFWFTTGHGDWTERELASLIGVNGAWQQPPSSISSKALIAVANRLNGLTRAELVNALSVVPLEWGTSVDDLEAMGWFLEERKGAVAARLSTLARSSRFDA